MSETREREVMTQVAQMLAPIVGHIRRAASTAQRGASGLYFDADVVAEAIRRLTSVPPTEEPAR